MKKKNLLKTRKLKLFSLNLVKKNKNLSSSLLLKKQRNNIYLKKQVARSKTNNLFANKLFYSIKTRQILPSYLYSILNSSLKKNSNKKRLSRKIDKKRTKIVPINWNKHLHPIIEKNDGVYLQKKNLNKEYNIKNKTIMRLLNKLKDKNIRWGQTSRNIFATFNALNITKYKEFFENCDVFNNNISKNSYKEIKEISKNNILYKTLFKSNRLKNKREYNFHLRAISLVKMV